MLHRVEQYHDAINQLLLQYQSHPQAELEFRLSGALYPAHILQDPLLKFRHTSYTTLIYEHGVRVRDGVAEKKTRIAQVDMQYEPISIKLCLAQESPHSMPASTEIPTMVRDISRWSTLLPGNVELSISKLDTWEVELEYMGQAHSTTDLLKPLLWLMQCMLPHHTNVMSVPDIHVVTAHYNRDWQDRRQRGFLRDVGYKPKNFTESDIPHIARYAASNKLDGSRYTLLAHLGQVYAVCGKDGMHVCQGQFEGAFDVEWDPHDKSIHVFDYQTRDSRDYKQRIQHAVDTVKLLKCDAVRVKPVFFDHGTSKILEWMKKTYKNWSERNDGIIYTPIKECYLAGEAHEHRTLKYKLPDKISIDLRLKLVKSGKEKKYTCWAAAAHNTEQEMRDVQITTSAGDPHHEELHDGVIAEVGLRDGVFYVMRLRLDKTDPNFHTVVQETLHDMRHPLPLERLKKLVVVHGGGVAKLPEVTEQTLLLAQPYVQQDRDRFLPAYNVIMQYVQTHKLLLSNPECLHSVMPTTFKIYSTTALKTANDIANALFAVNHNIYMKTVLPYREFEVSLLTRALAVVVAYPQVKHIRTDKLYVGVPTSMPYKLDTIMPEIELIDVFHRLYQPFPDHWEAAETQLQQLVQLLPQLTVGGKMRKNEFSKTVRTALYDALQYNELGVLVGHWGYHELFPTDPQFEKLQLLTTIAPADMARKLENILRDVTPVKLTYKVEDVHVGEMQLQRALFYFSFESERVALLDCFNNLTYEIVPIVTQGGKKLQVGNPYVLARFFLIDLWTLRVLHLGKFINSGTLQNKSTSLLNKVKHLCNKKELCGGTEYVGVYKDKYIERRRLLKLEDNKFYPYKPLDVYNKTGKLRQI